MYRDRTSMFNNRFRVAFFENAICKYDYDCVREKKICKISKFDLYVDEIYNLCYIIIK